MQKLMEIIDTYLDDKILAKIMEYTQTREKYLAETAEQKRAESELGAQIEGEGLEGRINFLEGLVTQLRKDHEDLEIMEEYEVESIISNTTLTESDIEEKIIEVVDEVISELTISR